MISPISGKKKPDDVVVVNKATQMLDKEIDVIHLVKRMLQLERLKNLLLTEEQRILFDNLPGPEIDTQISEEGKINPASSESLLSQLYTNYEDKPELAHEKYKSMSQKTNKSSIDKILIEVYKESKGEDHS